MGIIVILALMTLGAACIYGYISAAKTQERLHANTRPSTLASDGPDSYGEGEKAPDT